MGSENLTVMISCVGRQVSLVEHFRSAVGESGRVLACDVDVDAAGCAAAERSFVSPVFDNPDYSGWILDTCRRERVSLLLSLVPEDLLQLESLRVGLGDAGTRLVGMPGELLQTCLDKARLAELCKGGDFMTPPAWSCSDLESTPHDSYPLLAKVRSGSGSRGMVMLATRAIAESFVADQQAADTAGAYVLQPTLVGREYGLDVVNDLEGNHVTTFVRKKLRMRGGETDVAETACDARLSALGCALGETLRHQGPCDVDIMRCDDGDYLLDVNPRFGGGYVFSHAAGADLPSAMIAWHVGRTPDPAWLDPAAGIRSARISGLQRLAPGL